MPAYPVPANQRSRNNVSNIISVGSVTRADGAGNQRLIEQQACSSVLQQAQTLEVLSVESSVCNTKHYTKTLAFLYLLQFLKAPKAELLCQNQNAIDWEGESSLGCVCGGCNEHLRSQRSDSAWCREPRPASLSCSGFLGRSTLKKSH